jgi:hypothetical protein
MRRLDAGTQISDETICEALADMSGGRTLYWYDWVAVEALHRDFLRERDRSPRYWTRHRFTIHFKSILPSGAKVKKHRVWEDKYRPLRSVLKFPPLLVCREHMATKRFQLGLVDEVVTTW